MFINRLLTSIVLAPLLIAFLFYAKIKYLLLFIVILSYFICSEWTNLIPSTSAYQKFLFWAGLLLANIFIFHFIGNYIFWLYLVWIINFIVVISYPNTKKYWDSQIYILLLGLVILSLFLQGLCKLYMLPNGKSLILYNLILIWAADVGAYLIGKLYGKNKLIKKVSPGKTIEGLFGGLFFALIIIIIGTYFFKPTDILIWIVISFTVVLFSMLGDLLISVLKRRCNLKDTGKLLPGHGGILDRIDSLISAVPLFFLALMYFNILK